MKLLFEIGMEEIPARFLNQALKDLKNNFEKIFTDNRIKFSDIKTYGTPRRLVIYIEDLSEKQEDLNELNLGPSKDIAYINGELSRAGLGFVNSQKIDIKDLEIVKTEKGEYIAARKVMKGDDTEKVLPELIKNAILSLNFPKSMKWSDKKFKFARPIKWFLVLFGEKIVNFEIEGIKSSNISRGHRFFGTTFEVKNADDYFEKIRENNVIIDIEERKNLIKQMINEKLEKGEQIAVNDELMSEVTNLVEYPYPIIGTFNEEFLEVPQEVLIISMQVHQRYFPILDENNKLLPKFIVIRNGVEYSEKVKTGNEKVLSARLSDARFFYHEDLKIPLDKNVEKLKTVVFQKDLGTIYSKIQRIKKISEFLMNKLNIENKSDVLRTCELAKADLVSNMIGEKEFTKLQGLMGADYALKQGENQNVSLGIKEHYLPRFTGDILPTKNEGAIVGIADRIDTLVGCFGVGLIPSGSKDPYALRRAALGIVNIILNSSYNISLNDLVDISIKALVEDKVLKRDVEELKKDVLEFLKQRVINVLSDRGHSKNIISSVLSIKNINPCEILEKVEIIEDFNKREDFAKLLNSIKRISNILTDKNISSVDISLFENEDEKALYEKAVEIENEIQIDIIENNYKKYLEKIIVLSSYIDKFFENTKIIVEDEKIKNNRINILKYLMKIFNEMFDMSKIIEE